MQYLWEPAFPVCPVYYSQGFTTTRFTIARCDCNCTVETSSTKSAGYRHKDCRLHTVTTGGHGETGRVANRGTSWAKMDSLRLGGLQKNYLQLIQSSFAMPPVVTVGFEGCRPRLWNLQNICPPPSNSIDKPHLEIGRNYPRSSPREYDLLDNPLSSAQPVNKPCGLFMEFYGILTVIA